MLSRTPLLFGCQEDPGAADMGPGVLCSPPAAPRRAVLAAHSSAVAGSQGQTRRAPSEASLPPPQTEELPGSSPSCLLLSAGQRKIIFTILSSQSTAEVPAVYLSRRDLVFLRWGVGPENTARCHRVNLSKCVSGTFSWGTQCHTCKTPRQETRPRKTAGLVMMYLHKGSKAGQGWPERAVP